MALSLRNHFGPLAGSLAHAAALLMLARVSVMDGEDLGDAPVDASPPANDREALQRLTAMLEELVALTGVTPAELRAEGFPEAAVAGATGASPRTHARHAAPLLPRYDAALKILREVLR